MRRDSGRGWTQFLRPRWLALHITVLAVCVTMVLLGRWQLHVSDRKHFDLQNFSYTLQWWLFTAFALYFWVRLMRDGRRDPSGGDLVRTDDPARPAGPANLVARTPGQPPVVYRGYVIPSSATTPARSDDPHHAAYNDYLWQLGLADSAGSTPPPRARPELDGSAE